MFKETVDFIKSQFAPKEFLPLHEPLFIGNEKKYVADCIDSTYVSSVGKYVDRFEKMICDYTGAGYAIATVNGTAALHTCLLLGGIKRGDLVLTQPLSFIATCNAINYVGAEPVFVDIDLKTLGLSPDKLEIFLEENTRTSGNKCIHKESGKTISACMPMHTLGHPAEIDRIISICGRYNIVVIEDAAESIGSYFKNKHTGVSGLLGAFSFNGNKTITCGGGGIVVTNDAHLAKLAKHITTTAKIPHPWEFNHDQIAYNYRLPNLNAALACAQMEKLGEFVDSKRSLASSYAAYFKTQRINFFTEPENAKSNYWLNAILLESKEQRDLFLKFSNDNGVMTRPLWTLMNKLPMFQNSYSGNLANAESISQTLVNIPSGVRL